MTPTTARRRWPKGTWMRLQSGATLKALMEQKRLSRRTLARYCGLAGSGMIDHLIAGRKTSCTVQLAQRIAEALEVPLELLFVPKVPSAGTEIDKRHAA